MSRPADNTQDARAIRIQGRPDLKNTNPEGIYSGMTKRNALRDGEWVPKPQSGRKRSK